jgi:hypothetical protein
MLANGVASVHWDGARLAKRIMANICSYREPTAGYEGTHAFFDMETVNDEIVIEPYKFFPVLYRRQPDAVFILNTRSRDAWIASRLAHCGGDYAHNYRVAIGIPTQETLVRYWIEDWERHHAFVRSFFTGRGRLVEFNIEIDGPETLVAAMPEFNLDPSRYERVSNKSDRYVRIGAAHTE